MLNEDLNADFYSMFIDSYDNSKKNKDKGKDKAKNSSEVYDDTIAAPIAFEIAPNASKFAAFSAIRSLVLEHETKNNTLYKLENQSRSRADDDGDEYKSMEILTKDESRTNIPYIVSAGIQTLFDIISETKHQHPAICSKALSSLFDIFQGHDPESFKFEPESLFQSLYDLLLDLATWSGASPQKTSANNDEKKFWSATSCSVLLALCVARGDTGKIIKAITSVLMTSNATLTQSIKLPNILINLQKSVECAALGRPEKPTFYEHGIPENSLIDEFQIKNISSDACNSASLASDGKFLYILLDKSLYKVGSGYNGTTKALIYRMNKEFTKDKHGWIGFCRDKLYYKKISKRNTDNFILIDRETLLFQSPQLISCKNFKKDVVMNYTLYSDGDTINAISAVKDDNFVIREIMSSNDFSFDLTLNLAKRSFRTYGYTPFEEDILNNSQLQKIQSSFNSFDPALPDDSEICGIFSGKEFGLVMSSNYKVYYFGKGASLGLKSLIKSPSLKLSELTISKVSKVVQASLGHDGLHTLLLSDDGSVFFAGTVRRGEDGEISKRRLLKPTKPKRISRLDNHFIVQVSCNNGTSAFVTKTGKLIMFGKDTSFCDSHGIVMQLQEQHIVKVALGKAHAVALNSKGQIFSFGVNNKGQCGRCFNSKDRAMSEDYFASRAEKVIQNQLAAVCDIDEHEVVEEHCKICKICFECSGYNKMCAAATKIALKSRIPGSNCFCGHGNSGCIKCGACTTCISKQENDINNDQTLESQEQQKRSKKEVKINIDEVSFPNESERVAPLLPAKIIIQSASPVIQIACGLHHTVVLTAVGEVFTFGSNQYGQLGTGDLQPVTSPVIVKIPVVASQVAAGSNHTVILSSKGVVYTFGNFQKGQLGRLPTDVFASTHPNMHSSFSSNKSDQFSNFNDFQAPENAGKILSQRQRFLWNCVPAPITGIGPNYRKKVCWISASGDQTFIKIDESLVNARSLTKTSVAANRNTIIFISNNEGVPGCITINKQDGKCRTHFSDQHLFNLHFEGISDDQSEELASQNLPEALKETNDLHSSSSSPSSSVASVSNTIFTFDPLYDVLWCFDVVKKKMLCFNILASKAHCNSGSIFKSDVTLPNKSSVNVTRAHACLNVLACLDTLACVQSSLDSCFESDEKSKSIKSNSVDTTRDSKETRKITRFETFGNGWGYFSHSLEAIRFMSDTDILMDGIGMYGGRGEYTCKIKIFDLGVEGGGVENDGATIFEIDDIPYYCPARTIHSIMFQKSVNIVGGKWYLLWVKVSGPSSDCGSSGQNIIVGDDQVVFTFKSSKKSNNGTDINSGQIPSILYRIVLHDRKISDGFDKRETVCKISKDFINTISSENFENLEKLLSWSWNQFKMKINETVDKLSSNDEVLLKRYVYTCQVCLRLLNKYINQIYPSESFKYNESNGKSIAARSYQHSEVISLTSEMGSQHASRKNNVEKIQLAESIGNVRELLIQIFCDDLSSIGENKSSSKLICSIMDECNQTFVSCFNAFYPTSYLKWDCLCDLLSQMDKGVLHSRLLSGVLAGLCDSTVNLKSTFSIMSPYTEKKSITSPSDNSGYPILQSADNYHYPILVEQMMYRMQKHNSNPLYSNWNFKEILTRLLDIISKPLRLKIEGIQSNTTLDRTSNERLRQMTNYNLISNCCFLLSKILAEIVYQSCSAETDTTVISPYALQSTGIRFKKCDYSKTWNTGHFASDAICFTVDRSGIVLAGCCVYYGSGSYEYQIELLHDTLDSKSQMQHKWETVETTYGTFDQENVHRNMVQLKFERHVPLRDNVCYAVRFCAQGNRTCSGDAGYPSVRGPCGTIFRFYPCDLSFNGTTQTRGQIPSLLYYSVPVSCQGSKIKNHKEIFARDIALEFASDIISRSKDLLVLARNAFVHTLSSSSDKSSSNSSNTTQAFDSEHNITPIEEHFDVSWLTPTVSSAPMIKPIPFVPYFVSSSSTKEGNIHNAPKDLSKRIETFSRGLIETLKLDKKFERSTVDCVEVDNAAEITPNDFIDLCSSKKKRIDTIDSQINGNVKKPPLMKSDSEDSLFDRDRLSEIFSTQESSLFHTLLPLTVAHISRLISSDPKVSVEVLNLVKSILPHVSSWNQISKNSLFLPMNKGKKRCSPCELSTTSNFYAIVESDHPYKGTSIYSYKVTFPRSVHWMSLEFDPQCGTAQPEDCLKILIPALNKSARCRNNEVKVQKDFSANKNDVLSNTEQQILIKKFNTESGWSTNAIIVPGNEILLSLETASNYLTDHKLNRYGFKCVLIGYENIDVTKSFNNSLLNLESEFSHLGGMCSANLMRRDLIFSDEKSDDFWATENTLKKHCVLLSKGLSITNGSLTINNILEYDITTEQSHERQFLKDFIFVAPDSAGGRLASWIQPESRLDPNRCELKLFQDPIQSGWPTKLVIETRDQYGEVVYVPNIKIQLKVTLSSNYSNEKRYSKMCKEQNVYLPLGKVNYEPVMKEKEKICIKSITAMKAYSQYSFEELRMYTPLTNKSSSDLMIAKDSGDQSYSVLWTPEASGNFVINIIIDGIQVNENYNLTVINANIPPPKEHALKKIQPQYKYRKYYAEYTSGLRVRLHPTLQADQIGIIRVNDVISFIEELENGDGVWVKLSTDSIRKFCSSWCPSEAWCLGYNKHFEKRLLFSLIGSSSDFAANPTDDMNNVKFFDDSEYYSLEVSSEIPVTNVFEDLKIEEDDEKPPRFDESQVERTNQSNITAAIAGVVEGGAHKLQAFQKWLKRDSVGDTNATIRKRNGSIPEVCNNNTLDLKNLDTDNIEADRLSNDINLTSPLLENILPTNKISKVYDSKTEASKDTNPFQKSQDVNQTFNTVELDEINIPKQALSPSVAETIRAIFAAFLWHEGLVHDAIACASFLKFHPTIPKNNLQTKEQRQVVLTKEEKIQQRHSVEITNNSSYLNARPSTLEALTKTGYCCVHYRKQRGKVNEHSIYHSTDDVSIQGNPPALKGLVFLWSELNKQFVSFVNKIMTDYEVKDTILFPTINQSEVAEMEHTRSKQKHKKLADEGNTSLAAEGGASHESTVWCEICDSDIISASHHSSYLQNTFTKHLKTNHPGCGESAKGKGYNSNGVYCEGWAGQCGEEGVGATSWYLMCESCREKAMTTNKKPLNVNESHSTRTGIQESKQFTSINPSTFTKKCKLNSNLNSDFFDIMKENALFLLDLNSHNSGILKTSNNLLSSEHPTRYLKASEFGTQSNTSNFTRPSSTVLEGNQRKSSLQTINFNLNNCGKKNRTSSIDFSCPELLWTPPETITCLEMLNARMIESDSCNAFSLENENKTNDALVSGAHLMNQEGVANNENKFHRSFSMIQGWNLYSSIEQENSDHEFVSGANQVRANNENRVVMRRKKTCMCDSANEANLLNFPSKNLKKLVPDHVLKTVFKEQRENLSSSSHGVEKDLQNYPETKKLTDNAAFLDLLQQHNDYCEGSKNYSLLNRPTMKFIFEKNDLDKLRYLLRKNLRKAICSAYGLQALNWLLRTVTQTMCVHDLMWWFLSSLVHQKNENENVLRVEDSDVSYEHPVVISNVDDRIQNLLTQNLHMLLQSIADITLALPSGSPLQRLAIQCFGIKFRPIDHQFLHSSHVFGNISKILSKSEEYDEENLLYSTAILNLHLDESNMKNQQDKVVVCNHVDITDIFEFIISSRQAMACALTDNSTETFWESDDEDRNKPKIIEISMIKPHYICKSVNIHIDNCRDLAHKVTSFTVYSGPSLGELNLIETVETESNIGTWYSVLIKDDLKTHFRIEFRGVENNIRVRQIKILGYSNDAKMNTNCSTSMKRHTSALYIQQKYCELETLKVFRLLTNQVFGKLIKNQERSACSQSNPPSMIDSHIESPEGNSMDLREHMVGILFSRSKLTHLQKQIIVHIVHSIRKEAQKSREEWETYVSTISSMMSTSDAALSKSNDVYCFEMLSMVLALSGSSVGRSYLSHQIDLLKDLLILLHAGSERVQRQVTLLLRRILPEISPETLCDILEITYNPKKDINSLLQNGKQVQQTSMGIIDILLAIIAKSLQIQVKFKNGSNPKNLNVKLCDYISHPIVQSSTSVIQKNAPVYQNQVSSGTDGGCSNISEPSQDYESVGLKEELHKRWFLCGTSSTKLAENIIVLIKDMMQGKMSEKWSIETKAAVAECIINLAHLDDFNRQPENCLKTPTTWLALASLCVLSEDHVLKLSSGQWSKTAGNFRPLCINHDDSVTNAVIECLECGTLCCDCDRFLHLNRKTWTHHRTVCKEEEDSIKVELHESCGRIKLFWMLGLADSKTLKGIIEFRDGHVICDPQNPGIGRCRFCGIYGNSGLLAVGNVCVDEQCQEYSANACSKILACSHCCAGIINEVNCPPCLNQKCQSATAYDLKKPKLTQDGDDMCMICFTEALSCAPSIQMSCGHVFHFHCSKLILQKRWHGARISFAFSQCPICKSDILHESLKDLLEPINALKDDVKRKAVMRLKYEGIDKEIIDDQKNLAAYAMERYAYYVCCKCQKAYYGGEARCDVEMGENFNPEELVCGGCSDIAKAQMCPKHGMDFLEYKCRYCCSVAVFFCFGTTHFCDTCHDDFQRLTNIPKIKLPKCPAGPKALQLLGDECPLHIVHPPTGEEFALGCGICRNFHTF